MDTDEYKARVIAYFQAIPQSHEAWQWMAQVVLEASEDGQEQAMDIDESVFTEWERGRWLKEGFRK